MHKSQIFFYLLSAFVLGVFVSSFGFMNYSGTLFLAVAGLAIVALSFYHKLGLLVGFIVLAFAVGGARFNLFDLADNNLRNLSGQEVTLVGYVDSEPEIEGNRTRFVFQAEGERILVTTGTFPERKFGDQLTVLGDLELPQNFTEFDYATYLKKDGIKLTIFYPEEINEGNVNLSWGERFKIVVYGNIFKIKNKFESVINLSIPEPNASFVNGILLGSRQNIPDDLREAFNKTGTTHILAISGYNIMIISEAVLLGLIWFFRRRVAFWISVVIIVAFVILTGASSSVVRAAIMGLLLSFAQGYGRLYDQKNSIILAGAAMIWINPMILVFDVGFQLSFAAVFGLVYLYPFIESKLYKIPSALGFKELILMTFSAQMVVLPLALYYFGNFSLLSLPTNVLILPMLPYSMLSGFITGIAGMIYLPAGQIMGYIAWAITTYQIWVVNFFA